MRAAALLIVLVGIGCGDDSGALDAGDSAFDGASDSTRLDGANGPDVRLPMDGECPPDLTLCDDDEGRPVCVDTTRDDCHCGGCNTICICRDGECDTSCAEGQFPCDRLACEPNPYPICADFQTDEEHCGGCYRPCEATQICNMGECEPS